MAKNALKCVTQANTAPLPASCTVVFCTVLACLTHFSAFLTNFRRHFGTFIEVISTQILNSRIQLDYLYRHAKYQICSVSKSTLNFCLKIGFKFAWPFYCCHWILRPSISLKSRLDFFCALCTSPAQRTKPLPIQSSHSQLIFMQHAVFQVSLTLNVSVSIDSLRCFNV